MSEHSPGKRLFGGILMGVGILIAGASGLCSVLFLADGSADAEFVQIVLLVGGIPFVFGLMFLAGGYALFRSGKATPPGDGTRF
jgi:hypothetical protein